MEYANTYTHAGGKSSVLSGSAYAVAAASAQTHTHTQLASSGVAAFESRPSCGGVLRAAARRLHGTPAPTSGALGLLQRSPHILALGPGAAVSFPGAIRGYNGVSAAAANMALPVPGSLRANPSTLRASLTGWRFAQAICSHGPRGERRDWERFVAFVCPPRPIMGHPL